MAEPRLPSMQKYRYVNTKFWTDKYIVSLDIEGKLLFIYFLTNPLANICGIYEITIRQIVFDTGMPAPVVSKLLKQFQADKKIFYFFEYGWIYIKNFQKHQKLNPSIIAGIAKAMKDIPKLILDEFERLDKDFAALRRNPEEQLIRIQQLKAATPLKGMK